MSKYKLPAELWIYKDSGLLKDSYFDFDGQTYIMVLECGLTFEIKLYEQNGELAICLNKITDRFLNKVLGCISNQYLDEMLKMRNIMLFRREFAQEFGVLMSWLSKYSIEYAAFEYGQLEVTPSDYGSHEEIASDHLSVLEFNAGQG